MLPAPAGVMDLQSSVVLGLADGETSATLVRACPFSSVCFAWLSSRVRAAGCVDLAAAT